VTENLKVTIFDLQCSVSLHSDAIQIPIYLQRFSLSEVLTNYCFVGILWRKIGFPISIFQEV